MPSDPQLQRQAMLEHYRRLVQLPGWEAYVRHQATLLAKSDPSLYGDFPDLLPKAMPSAPAGSRPRSSFATSRTATGRSS